MPKSPGRKSGSRLVWIIVAIISIAILSAGGYVLNLARTSASLDARADKIDADFDATAVRDKAFGSNMMLFKARFPNDYDALKSKVVSDVRAGATDADLPDVFAGFMQTFLHKHALEISIAPTENLKPIRAAQADIITELQRSSESQCASYYTTGVLRTKDLDPVARDDLARLSGAVLAAALTSGKQFVVRHGVTNEDDKALITEMRHLGMDDAQAAIYSDHNKLMAATPHEQCEVGVLNAQGLNNLPADIADIYIAQQFMPSNANIQQAMTIRP